MNTEDLQKYIDNKTQESLHLDYKASPALAKNKRNEIAKDVSAMANSDGGTIIYGIEEENNVPYKLDDGVSNDSINREWIEQILQSTVSPKLPSIKIIPIEASKTATYYVLKIQKSYSGPHQAPDKKYYKRYNFTSSPMDDYEIQDIKNRQINIERLVIVKLEVIYGVMFSLVVENIGSNPAEDVTFEFSPELYWKKPRIFTKGTKFLAPGIRFQYKYDQFLDDNSSKLNEFTVRVSYFHPVLNKRHSELFVFDLRDYSGIINIDNSIEEIAQNIQQEIKNGFQNVAETLRNYNCK